MVTSVILYMKVKCDLLCQKNVFLMQEVMLHFVFQASPTSACYMGHEGEA